MSDHFYTVTELTREIKAAIEGNESFSGIWVKGEVYNLTYHSSGHIYFTLKDDNALIAATFFKNANRRLNFKLEEGMKVLAMGSVTLYEKRGAYQLNVSQVRPEGIGELQKRIEQLKKKLEAEGIFDPARKRPLPLLPRKIGIVTSPTGAAVRDILKVALRRYPNIEILLAPAKVQGDDAARAIALGIMELNRPEYGVDVIIAGRGGGSFEDLMPFNEEIVVRAFYNSRVPIISAVGHQIDHPMCDDSADHAAPTPSAAAEMAVPVKSELTGEINYQFMRAEKALEGIIRHASTRLESVTTRRVLRQPLEIVNQYEMLLADMERSISDAMRSIIAVSRERMISIPDLPVRLARIMDRKSHRFAAAVQALDQLSPLSIMKRGYAIALDSDRNIIRSAGQASEGDVLDLLMHDGSLACTVNSIKQGAGFGKEEKR